MKNVKVLLRLKSVGLVDSSPVPPIPSVVLPNLLVWEYPVPKKIVKGAWWKNGPKREECFMGVAPILNVSLLLGINLFLNLVLNVVVPSWLKKVNEEEMVPFPVPIKNALIRNRFFSIKFFSLYDGNHCLLS